MIWIARIFGLAALAVLISDVMGWLSDGRFGLSDLGSWWFWAHKDSLQVLQPALERHVEPWLPFSIWDPGVQTLLLWPLTAQLAVIAGVFYLLARRRG